MSPLRCPGNAPPPDNGVPHREGNDDARWAAVVARDLSARAAFVYAVRSTGIYCRPGCAARRPRRDNTAFFAGPSDARAAGYRPCMRCRPDEDQPDCETADRIAAACRLIEDAEEQPSLSELARATGLGRYHFHRLFKATVGLTPRAFGAACRARRLRERIKHAQTVTAAAYDAGFNSSGRFYAAASAMLGMTPSAYRSGGTGADIRFGVGQCTLGAILVAATEKGLCAIAFGDDPDALVRDLQDRFPAARLIGGDSAFEATMAQAVGLVEAGGARPDLPLDIRGTAFQQRVWQVLRAIPSGETRTYGQVAAALGTLQAVRAVARACAANPLAVAIPCHRVVRRDGAASGYRWGIERKQALLAREETS